MADSTMRLNSGSGQRRGVMGLGCINLWRLGLGLAAWALSWAACASAPTAYTFGVLSQRSPAITAEYWNPILDYVSRRSGVRLWLKIARTAPESNDAIARGEYDFVYSNTIFLPDTSAQGYRVILRPAGEGITGQIVTLADSPIRSLQDLDGKVVGFPSRAAFVGYAVPMDHLLRQGIRVTPVFGGNQEGVMAQLKAGHVLAAGVNNQVMRAFAEREGVRYRVLWESQTYANLPISVHPRVPPEVAEAVRKGFLDLTADPEGQRLLRQQAAILKLSPPYGFLPASNADYRNYFEFYRQTLVKDIE